MRNRVPPVCVYFFVAKCGKSALSRATMRAEQTNPANTVRALPGIIDT